MYMRRDNSVNLLLILLPQHVSAFKGHVDIARFLIDQGVSIDLSG